MANKTENTANATPATVDATPSYLVKKEAKNAQRQLTLASPELLARDIKASIGLAVYNETIKAAIDLVRNPEGADKPNNPATGSATCPDCGGKKGIKSTRCKACSTRYRAALKANAFYVTALDSKECQNCGDAKNPGGLFCETCVAKFAEQVA